MIQASDTFPAPPLAPGIRAPNVDITNCDRELVQFPGAIQPHGALLVLEEPSLRVLQASLNTSEICGTPAATLLGQGVELALGAACAEQVQARLAKVCLEGEPVHLLSTRLPGQDRELDLFAHHRDGILLLELERIDEQPPLPIDALYARLGEAISYLQSTPRLQPFLDAVVAQVRGFLGFDRVMVYRFFEDGAGSVIAETRREDLPAFLGLHYPASDIPEPARRLFQLLWLRHLPDACYQPVPLLPETHPVHGGDLDLSYALLRSVSPMYRAYMQHMEVASTVTMPLFKGKQLWGLIAGHHLTPRHLPQPVRQVCALLAQFASALLAAKEDQEFCEYRLHLGSRLQFLVERMAISDRLELALAGPDSNLLSGFDAQGAALIWHEQLILLGTTPSAGEVRALADWLHRETQGLLFATHQLARHYPPAEAFQAVTSGLLATRLSRKAGDFALWFRPEHIQEVHWAGDPRNPVAVEEQDGEWRLGPRKSFARWKETVRGCSRPWLEQERQYAADLGRALLDVVGARAVEIGRLNEALKRRNTELDAFAYVVSHDLKEPLRGIHNYAMLLKRSAGEQHTGQQQVYLETLIRLTQRMDGLIEALLNYARVEQTPLGEDSVDLNEVVDHVLEGLGPRILEAGVEVRIPSPLPRTRCDQVRVAEVFHNLISNAIKYNDKPEPWVEIGWRADTPPVFHVRDNGIGIAAADLDTIFQIFRRLHGRHEFGGGSGVGLTIARKIISLHGGRLWVASSPREGTTFYFTLEPSD